MPDAPSRAVLSPAFRLVFRLEIANRPGMFARVATVVGERGCSLGAIDLVEATPAVHARALAMTMPESVRSAEYILPSVFDRDVVPAVAKAVAAATRAAGLARKTATPQPA